MQSLFSRFTVLIERRALKATFKRVVALASSLAMLASPNAIAAPGKGHGNKIAKDLADAAKMKEEADVSVAAYEQELAAARNNAAEIGNKARDASKAKSDAERKAAEAGLEAKIADAEKRIAKIRASGMAEVGKIAEEAAGAILTQLTGGKVSASEIAAAVKSVKG